MAGQNRAPGRHNAMVTPGRAVTIAPAQRRLLDHRAGGVTADPYAIGRLTTAVGEAGGIVTAVDVVDSDPQTIVADLTCDTADAAHAAQVSEVLRALEGVEVRKVSDRTFLLHLGGKIEVTPKVALRNRDELSRAYTPGSRGSAWRSPRTPTTPAG